MAYTGGIGEESSLILSSSQIILYQRDNIPENTIFTSQSHPLESESESESPLLLFITITLLHVRDLSWFAGA